MKYFFPGIFGAFLLGWLVQVILPYNGMGKLDPLVDADTGDVYPVDISGLAEQGRQVYAANGCVSCHTQQVRAPYMGADLERKWGARRSVARDYMYEDNVFLGTLRMGPDLAGVGARDVANTGEKDLTTPAARQKLTAWHYLHLYNPRMVNAKSVMPAYPWLFKERKIKGQPSDKALVLDADHAPAEGNEVLPTAEAETLVAYLLSLDKNHSLPESKKVEVAAK